MDKHFVQKNSISYSCKKNNGKYKSILLPPPNITGELHIGHALSTTLQDIMVRFWKMTGYNVLWQLGTDHAGIATEIILKKYLKEKKICWENEKELLQYAEEWAKTHQEKIFNQMKEMGFDIENMPIRYTMDSQYKKFVQNTFKKLMNDGLITKQKRLINWDSQEQTAISDLEVIHEQKKSILYYIQYTLSHEKISIATTRPETIFADQALAVNPNGKHKHLIGKSAVIPIINKTIPIIGDEHANDSFGSGIVKITPAHDFNDFKVGKKHNLNLNFNIFNKDGTLNEFVPLQYRNLTINQARNQIVSDLKVEIEHIITNIPRSFRTNVVIEPMISEQWFLNVKNLANNVLKQSDKIYFNHNWKTVHDNWLKNIEPWCISRQIKWGHKILNTNDVLDTWFSSSLWPNSISNDNMKFFPFTVLFSGHDIIFFWIARMNMMSLYLNKQLPFKNIILHPLILDKNGEKMSKTRGNVINPLHIAKEYGSDALRLTLVNLSSAIHSARFNSSHVKGFKHFVTKIWNSVRCANSLGLRWQEKYIEPTSDLDIWMVNKIIFLIKRYKMNMENFVYDINYLISSFRNDFCDIYMEVAKKTQPKCWPWILSVFVSMFFPFIPFVCSSILKEMKGNDFFIPDISLNKKSNFEHIAIIIRKIFKLKSLCEEFTIEKTNNEYFDTIISITKIKSQNNVNGLCVSSGPYNFRTSIENLNGIEIKKNKIINKLKDILSIFKVKSFLINASQEIKLNKIDSMKKLLDDLHDVLFISSNEDYSLFRYYEQQINDIHASISSGTFKKN